MKIGAKRVGRCEPVYVIAEIGVNHDGDVRLACELTRAAARAGADAVKLQFFTAERLMSGTARLAMYQADAGECDPLAMLHRLELTIGEMERVVALAHELGLQAIVTVFSVELVEESRRAAWDAYKVASPDVVNRPLLRAVARVGKPMIVSTGAATAREVVDSFMWLSDMDDRLAYLQCVSAYPTPMDHAAIGGVLAVERLTGCPTGYSDHTAGVETGAIARRLGACILEKHLTYDRRASGPDHAASLSPEELREYVRLARDAEPMNEEECRAACSPNASVRGIGTAEKLVLPIEEDVRQVSRQSLTAARDLPAGHRLTRNDLTIKRPGTGIAPALLEAVIGRVLVLPVRADTLLTEATLQGCETNTVAA